VYSYAPNHKQKEEKDSKLLYIERNKNYPLIGRARKISTSNMNVKMLSFQKGTVENANVIPSKRNRKKYKCCSFEKRNSKNKSVVPLEKEQKKCKCCSFGKRNSKNKSVVPSEKGTVENKSAIPSKRE